MVGLFNKILKYWSKNIEDIEGTQNILIMSNDVHISGSGKMVTRD